jgi:potassium intermediate/small conductance calcium-activated channel subfamily N protein 2
MCFLGLFGIALMIIDNEITFATDDDKDTVINWIIKLIISCSTVILIGLVLYYHKLDLKLYCIRNSVDDWRIGLTSKKIFFIIIEILVCAIHPVPRHFYNSTTISPIDTLPISYTSLDVALGLPSK